MIHVFWKYPMSSLCTKCIYTWWLRDLVRGHCRDQSYRQVLCGDLASSELWLSIGWLHHPSYLPKQNDDKPKFIPQVSNTWPPSPPPRQTLPGSPPAAATRVSDQSTACIILQRDHNISRNSSYRRKVKRNINISPKYNKEWDEKDFIYM